MNMTYEQFDKAIGMAGMISRQGSESERRFAKSILLAAYAEPFRYPTQRQALWLRIIAQRQEQELCA